MKFRAKATWIKHPFNFPAVFVAISKAAFPSWNVAAVAFFFSAANLFLSCKPWQAFDGLGHKQSQKQPQNSRIK